MLIAGNAEVEGGLNVKPGNGGQWVSEGWSINSTSLRLGWTTDVGGEASFIYKTDLDSVLAIFGSDVVEGGVEAELVCVFD